MVRFTVSPAPNPCTAAEWAACGEHGGDLEPFGRFSEDCSYCQENLRRLDAFARQQVEAAYREGCGQGKMRFTQMKVKEAVEAFRERACSAICYACRKGILHDEIEECEAAAIRALKP